MRRCYIIVEIDPKTLKIVAVGAYSESPATITRAFSYSPSYKIMATLYDVSGSSYASARKRAIADYKRYDPQLFVRFPIEE